MSNLSAADISFGGRAIDLLAYKVASITAQESNREISAMNDNLKLRAGRSSWSSVHGANTFFVMPKWTSIPRLDNANRIWNASRVSPRHYRSSFERSWLLPTQARVLVCDWTNGQFNRGRTRFNLIPLYFSPWQMSSTPPSRLNIIRPARKMPAPKQENLPLAVGV